MQTLTTTPSSVDLVLLEDAEPSFLEVEGIEGSTLRATATSLVVLRRAGASPVGERHWAYDEIGSLRLDAYGSIGVIRATIRTTGTDLPMLLLEPDQITAARRGLEIIWNLMGSRAVTRKPA